MTVKSGTALILEGGGNRGVFTSGVLDCLMEHQIKFPYVVGVSAGACNAVDYVSWQPGRTKNCMILEDKENRYISLRQTIRNKSLFDMDMIFDRFPKEIFPFDFDTFFQSDIRISLRQTIRNKSLFDMDMIFDRFPKEIFPFDFDTFFQSDIRCQMVVTDCITGKARYMEEKKDSDRLMNICRASSSIPAACPMVMLDGRCITGKARYMEEKKDSDRLMNICRASSSIPAACPMVMLDGRPYLDGGVSDSIPLFHAMKLGYQKDVVVLTRNLGYRKTKPGKSAAFYSAAFKKYPNLVRSLLNRYKVYNRTLDLVEKWEREGHIFVIRPVSKPISRTEQDKEALTAFYQEGYDLMEKRLEELQAYLLS